MSTTEGALHARAVAKGRSPLKPMSFFTDVVLLVVVRCVVSVKGVVEIGVNTSISALAQLLRHAAFCVAYPQRSCPNTTGWVTTPGDEEGVPANAYIYVFVLWGGSCEEVTTHFFTSCPMSFPTPAPYKLEEVTIKSI